MKLFTPVAVVCDHTMVENAAALRAMLEAYRLRVDFYRFVQKPQVFNFFSQDLQYPYTIIFCHGMGEGDENMHMALEVVEQEDDDYDQTDGWSMTTVQMTPAWIAEHVQGRSGSLISTACGSGREPLARAILGAGYSSYIAPVETYYNADAGLIFVANFFYFLMSEDRDFAPVIFSECEAVENASNVDLSFQFGPKVFRCYPLAQHSVACSGVEEN